MKQFTSFHSAKPGTESRINARYPALGIDQTFGLKLSEKYKIQLLMHLS